MSRIKALRLAVFVLVLASLILAACAQPVATTAPEEVVTEAPAPATTEEQPAEPPAEAEQPADRKVATFIWTQEFDTLNPLYTNMWFSGTTLPLWNCYAWLFDDQNNPVPSLINEIPSTANGGVSEDGRTITLKLRDDLKWSDGTPLTAKDFIFTYEMTINTSNAVSTTSPYDLVESVTAPDDLTVVTTFKEPYAPWLGTLWKGIVPEHILRPVFDAEGTLDTAEWNKAPTVGCGPFNFAEWESGSFARFVANENYWLGRPKLDEIFFQFVPDDASQVAALKNGEGHLGTFMTAPDAQDLEKSGMTIYKVFSGYNEGIYFNLGESGHPALKELAVRQAIAYATDRLSITTDLWLGLTVPASTMWDNMPYIDPTITPFPFDPEKAKQLLDEAGWVDSNEDGTRDKDGVELMLTYGTTTREIRKDTQAVLQQQLADVGIGVELLNFESDNFFAGYAEGGPAARGELDIHEYSATPNFPDPDTADWLCNNIPSEENPAGSNWAYLCDEKLDGLFQLQATQVDPEERINTFHEISRYVFDNVLWLGLWQDPDIFAISPELLNVKLSGATPFFNSMEWDLVQ